MYVCMYDVRGGEGGGREGGNACMHASYAHYVESRQHAPAMNKVNDHACTNVHGAPHVHANMPAHVCMGRALQ